jgi:hypothetical protein
MKFSGLTMVAPRRRQQPSDVGAGEGRPWMKGDAENFEPESQALEALKHMEMVEGGARAEVTADLLGQLLT